MGLVDIIILLGILGVVLWFVNTTLPGPVWIKTLINVIAALFVFLTMANALGFHSSLFHSVHL